VTRLRVTDGAWNDPNGWNPPGVPGTSDFVQINDSHVVMLNGTDVACRALNVSPGRLSGPGSVTVTESLLAGFSPTVLENLVINIPANARLFVNPPEDGSGLIVFDQVTINNDGLAILTGSSFDGRTSVLNNHGTSTFGNQLRQASQGRPTLANLGTVNNHGTFDGSGAVTKLDSTFSLKPGGILILGAPIVAGGGGNIVAGGGGNIVAGGGGNFIVASLIGNDGAGVVSNDGAGVLPTNGVGIVAGGGGNRSGPNSRENSGHRVSGPGNQPLIQMLGGKLSGTGIIEGDVENAAGSLNVGSDLTGAIAINGNYTQGANASLLLDLSGSNGQAGQYDLLKISGVASLNGGLNMGAPSGTDPGQTTIVPLAYGSVSGGFSVVGASTQVTFTQNGALVTADPPPRFLQVASVQRLTDGHFLLKGKGIAGATYRIQATTSPLAGFDPNSWIGTATADNGGNFEFEDTTTGGVARRFYRAIYP
jgi:hypothetical protein